MRKSRFPCRRTSEIIITFFLRFITYPARERERIIQRLQRYLLDIRYVEYIKQSAAERVSEVVKSQGFVVEILYICSLLYSILLCSGSQSSGTAVSRPECLTCLLHLTLLHLRQDFIQQIVPLRAFHL